MTRGQSKKNKAKDDAKLSQTPEKDIIRDGRDVEYKEEFADENDIEAKERAEEADHRAKQKRED
ncbi:YfhD family protein [Pontibacillus yanchengensis]|uniref:YfhD family protein n=2 Tax=Pontibacillus yanchengensis TaxID=462910 RepID=A0ACC7VC89_9BACI|nr:YfhD family protein [Pontibacillus yanchengensis]MYL32890.1 YfhD family protein [Pontibacillus yanchengensis]MYL51799.1 YfhD family protein [Pontibacillus yanchengensis]